MTATAVIYDSLVNALDLQASVKLMDDKELVAVRGALGRGDFPAWPAERIHGMVMLEMVERFVAGVRGGDAPAIMHPLKNRSGSVADLRGADFEKTEVIQ